MDNELQESHITPAFIFRWLRKTSPTGFVRMSNEPNRRKQDGLKLYLLCKDCEQLFSGYETKFANEIFYPFVNSGTRGFDYEDWMLKFCVSLTWRSLKYYELTGQLDEFGSTFIEQAKIAEKLWRNYLLSENDSPSSELEHHIYFMDSLIEVGEDDYPFINRYVQRVLDMDIVTTDVEAFVIVKIPYLSFIGFIGRQSDEKCWSGGELGKHNLLLTGEYTAPSYYWEHIKKKCVISHKMYDGISNKQRNKIDKARANNSNNPNRVASRKAIKDDIRLFGNNAHRQK